MSLSLYHLPIIIFLNLKLASQNLSLRKKSRNQYKYVLDCAVIRNEKPKEDLVSNLKKALSLVDSKDLKKLAKDVFLEDIIGTFKERGISLFLNLRSTISLLNIKNGRLFDLFGTVKNFILNMRHMTKKEVVTCLLKISLVLFGTYIGYEVPDMDIKHLGIGSHRHWIYHSFLIIYGVDVILKVIERTAKMLSEKLDHDTVKRYVSNIEKISYYKNLFVNGLYSGSMIHLFQDLFIDGSQSIRGPWGGTFMKGTYLDDNLYLAFNMVMSTPRRNEY